MTYDQFQTTIRLQWPETELGPYSHKKLAATLYKQRSATAGIAYLLPIVLLHMHLESLLLENFAAISFASRARISRSYNTMINN